MRALHRSQGLELHPLPCRLDLLHENGIAADLATPTAAPPAWFFEAHPEALPVDRDGRTLSYGSRQTFCPSSPAYRRAALRIAEALATIQKTHPAVSIGSYPFFADAGGPAGTTIVIRGRDPGEVEGAEREVLELARSFGVEPEKARDSR